MGERPFPQLSLWALAAKAWQLIWPHVLGQIVEEKKKKQRGSVRNGERGKEHERQQMCFHKGQFQWKQYNVNIQIMNSTFSRASFQSLLLKTQTGF